MKLSFSSDEYLCLKPEDAVLFIDKNLHVSKEKKAVISTFDRNALKQLQILAEQNSCPIIYWSKDKYGNIKKKPSGECWPHNATGQYPEIYSEPLDSTETPGNPCRKGLQDSNDIQEQLTQSFLPAMLLGQATDDADAGVSYHKALNVLENIDTGIFEILTIIPTLDEIAVPMDLEEEDDDAVISSDIKKPYKSRLLLGEADFSYAKALVEKQILRPFFGRSITATAYEN